jgi:peptidoglycan hydrolase CwlO-like protein
MKFFPLLLILLTTLGYAVDKYGNLTSDDQKYYKNDIMEGNNQRERIDSLVVEVNKLHGQISSMKSEIQQLKSEIDQLKKDK